MQSASKTGEARPVMSGAVRAVLADGRRRHFQHGPIDLVIRAWGDAGEVARAYAQGWRRFETVLGELVGELPALRTAISEQPRVAGKVAIRMVAAADSFRAYALTPMAAVAGAVAEEILNAMRAGRTLDKAYVNNGGDIAVHLAPGEEFKTGMVALAEAPVAGGLATFGAHDGVGGIATSGWRGRSFSLGIADSVTVLAADASTADVAATLIANAVTVESAAIQRLPASEIDPDSDLGAAPVTVDVGCLAESEIDAALANGARRADAFVNAGKITAASLSLGGKRSVHAGRAAPPRRYLLADIAAMTRKDRRAA